MVKLDYKHRFFFDFEFLLSIKDDKKLLMKLMYINASSASYPKRHNIILQPDNESAIKKGVSAVKISAGFKKINVPEFLENEKEEIARNVRTAIHLTNIPPYQTIIFTTPEQKKKYEDNGHFTGIKTVIVKAGKDAEEMIDYCFKQFCEKKEQKRQYMK